MDTPGEDFAFVECDGESVYDLDVVDMDPERNGAGCYLVVDDQEASHARTSAAGIEVS